MAVPWLNERLRQNPCAICGGKSGCRMRHEGQQMYLCANCAQKIYQDHSKIRQKVTSKMRKTVFARDGHKCVKCGKTAKLTIDHIKPIALGGDSSIGNLQTLCLTCNCGKADRRIGV